MRIALSLIVKGSDLEADTLAKSLALIPNVFDGLFITITQPNEKVLEVARAFHAHVSNFEWCNDFAKARNFAFSQIPKDYDYIMWLDADDGVRGLENLKGIIEKHPADAYALNYLYAFDEYNNPVVVHKKTQIVRNDGSFSWNGKLHEDLTANREIKLYFIKDIERIHLTTDERIEIAKERNLEVAKGDVEANPNDPRSYWNLANSQKAAGLDEESLQSFQIFLQMSQSDDEKYIARLRRAESLWALRRMAEAQDECRYAIGLKPHYPDAYNTLGSLLLETGQYEQASEMLKQGLVKKPPYYSIIVYNPRDYDYVPLMNLAKAYFALSLPTLALTCLKACKRIYPKDPNIGNLIRVMTREHKKFEEVVQLAKKLSKITDDEKLKKELAKVPKKYEAHPAICNIRNNRFVKTESTGKDLVFFCGFTEEIWTPDTAKKKGIGGSEEAVIWLSDLLSKKGWNVTVYNNCGNEVQQFGSVTYKPFWMWNYRDKQDVTIVWRGAQVLDFDINSKKIYLDLHDVIQAGELTEKRVSKLTKILVKSKFHRDLFPLVPDEKFLIVPNGIDPSVFPLNQERVDSHIERDPMLMVNTSSPDRSLTALLDIYELVKKEVPEAKLKWAYGWGVFDVVHGSNPKMLEWKASLQARMKELGVEELGRVSHGEVAKMYLEANIFLYPSEFAEIDCISLSKAQAAGAIPVTTDFAAMGEKKSVLGTYIHSEKTKDNWCLPYQYDFSLEDPAKKELLAHFAIKALQNPPSEEDRLVMRIASRDRFDWNKVADTWNDELSTAKPLADTA